MIQSVIKVGGSLARRRCLKALCRHLETAGTCHPMLIVPGGGPFADTVRAMDQRHRLSDSAAHWMAILAMDQYGYLLCDMIPGSRTVRTVAEALNVAASGRVPVLLPFSMVHRENPLPHTWSVTADTIAAWVAKTAGVSMLVLLKDTDGLYDTVPGTEKRGRLLPTIRLEQLAANGGVDPYLAEILESHPADLWIVNGRRPERLGELMATGQTVGTHYRPSGP